MEIFIHVNMPQHKILITRYLFSHRPLIAHIRTRFTISCFDIVICSYRIIIYYYSCIYPNGCGVLLENEIFTHEHIYIPYCSRFYCQPQHTITATFISFIKYFRVSLKIHLRIYWHITYPREKRRPDPILWSPSWASIGIFQTMSQKQKSESEYDLVICK